MMSAAVRSVVLGALSRVLSGAALDFDFVNGRGFNSIDRAKLTPDSILTYTSPSPKMVYGSDGVLRYAPHNFIRYSQEFDNATWTKTGVVVSADAITASDGSSTADRLVEDTGTSGHLVTSASHTFVAAPYQVSVEVKAAGRNFALISMRATEHAVSINLTTGATSVATGSPTGISATDKGNGWWKLEFTAIPTAGSAAVNVYCSADGVWANRSYLGDGASGIYVWGAQLNRGSSALTYTPTTSAAVYSLPIDHDPTTFAPLGVLIEEQRTNLLTYSEQFDNAAYTNSNITVAANAIAAPDGTTTADLLTAAAGASVNLQQSQVVAATSATYSIFAKKNSGAAQANAFRLLNTTTATTLVEITINYDTGAITYVTGSTGASAVSVGNGWWRIVLTATSGITSGDTIRCDQCFVGSTTLGYSAYIWGAQLEAGAFPTSYIPTVASQVTRAADQVSILTSAFGYNAAAGTVLVDGSINGNGTGNAGWWALDAGASQNGHSLRVSVGGNIVAISMGVSTNQTVVGLASAVAGTFYETAFAYSNENDRAISTDGAAVVEGTTAVGTINGATTLRLGFQQVTTTGGYINGHIKRLTYFPVRKTNAELQVLSR